MVPITVIAILMLPKGDCMKKNHLFYIALLYVCISNCSEQPVSIQNKLSEFFRYSLLQLLDLLHPVKHDLLEKPQSDILNRLKKPQERR
jgi:hypothetical protein